MKKTNFLPEDSKNDIEKYPANNFTIVILVITALFVSTQLYVSIPLQDEVNSYFGADSKFELATCFSMFYAIGFMLWGPIADFFGKRKIILLSMLLLCLITGLITFTKTPALLGILRSLQGFSAAGFGPVALAYLTEAIKPNKRIRAVGGMSCAFLLAGVFGQIYATTILGIGSWKLVFGLSTVLFIIFIIFILFFVPTELKLPSEDSLIGKYKKMIDCATNTNVVLLCVCQITLLLSFVAMYSALGSHLKEINVAESKLIIIRIAALPVIIVSLFVADLEKKIRIIYLAIIGYICAAAGLLLEGIFSKSIVTISIFSMLFVLGVALAIPSMIALFGVASHPNRAGGMAISGFYLFLGASIGPFLPGAFNNNFRFLLISLSVLLLFASTVLTLFKVRTENYINAG